MLHSLKFGNITKNVDSYSEKIFNNLCEIGTYPYTDLVFPNQNIGEI